MELCFEQLREETSAICLSVRNTAGFQVHHHVTAISEAHQNTQSSSHTLMTPAAILVLSSISTDALFPNPCLSLLLFHSYNEKKLLHSFSYLHLKSNGGICAQSSAHWEDRKRVKTSVCREIMNMAGEIKSPSTRFICETERAKAKHGPRRERVEGNH